MKSKLKKTNSQIKISRGEGNGLSYEGQLLPDNGASISFTLTKEKINVDFGYLSPAYKEYRRDLNIGLSQATELRNFLNKYINKFNQDEIVLIFHDPFFETSKIQKQFCNEKLEHVRMHGYKLEFYSNYKDENRIISELKYTGEKEDLVYGQVYKVDEKNLSAIQLMYDRIDKNSNFDFHLKQVGLEENGKSFFAYYFKHKISGSFSKKKITKERKEQILNNAKTHEYPDEYIELWK